MKDRLTLIKKIEEHESRKVQFEKVLKDISNYYFEDGNLTFDLKTNDFNSQYEGEIIKFNDDLMKSYLKSEIEQLETKINEMIESLRRFQHDS